MWSLKLVTSVANKTKNSVIFRHAIRVNIQSVKALNSNIFGVLAALMSLSIEQFSSSWNSQNCSS